MADDACLLCEKIFSKQKAGKRIKKSVSGKLGLHDVTIYAAMEKVYQFQGNAEGYLCNRCLPQLETVYKEHFETTGGTTEKSSIPSITTALKRSKYYTAFKQILSRGPVARNAFYEVIKEEVRNELAKYMKSDSINYPVLNSVDSVNAFSWSEYINDIGSTMPTLCAAVHGSMPSEAVVSEEMFRNIISPRIGVMCSIPLYTRSPKRFNFVQSLTGIEMHQGFAREKLFKCFHDLGLCQSNAATLKNIDDFGLEPEAELPIWNQTVDDWESVMQVLPLEENLDYVELDIKEPVKRTYQSRKNLKRERAESEEEDVGSGSMDDQQMDTPVSNASKRKSVRLSGKRKISYARLALGSDEFIKTEADVDDDNDDDVASPSSVVLKRIAKEVIGRKCAAIKIEPLSDSTNAEVNISVKTENSDNTASIDLQIISEVLDNSNNMNASIEENSQSKPNREEFVEQHCEHCEYTGYSYEAMRSHIRRNHPDIVKKRHISLEGLHGCEHERCKYRSNSVEALRSHVRRRHPRPFGAKKKKVPTATLR